MPKFNGCLRFLAALLLVLPALLRAQPTTPVTPIDPSINVTPGDGTTPGKSAAPPSLFGISGGGSVELGQSVTLTVSFSGTGADQTYVWKKNGTVITGATATSYSVGAVTAADTASYTVTVSNADGSSVASTDLTVKAAAAPVITTQPRTTTAQVGQPVTFSFVATGSFPRTYQWRKDSNDIAGATQAAYTIAAVTTTDAGVYTVAVSNGIGTATSSPASLTVNAATPPVIATGSPFDTTTTQGVQTSLFVSLNSGSSPFTIQWFKNGTAVPNSNNQQLSFASIGLADAGKYTVTITNAAGSATSREATLTVNPATPITFNTQPQSQTVVVGQSVVIFVSVSGSSPLTFQWQRNGAPIANSSTGSSYSINAATAADAGSYTVVATNVLGPVTSNSATLTVNPAAPPTITTQPQTQTVAYNGFISLSVQVSGSPPFTYQWKKDGVALSGGSFSGYGMSGATPANTGQYTVTVTNAAGSITSNVATVTVAAATLPRITGQPTATQVAAGLNAQFTVLTDTAGAGDVKLQWLKDGYPVSGATNNTLSITSVKDSDAGNYSAVLTSTAGSVTSTAAKLTVLPPAPPGLSYGYWPADYVVTLGIGASIAINNVTGSGPFTYQWFKDGVAMPGFTNAALNFTSVRTSDLGTYVLVVSNDAGAVATTPVRMRAASTNTPAPWLDAAQLGSTVFFLATSPARIERYDLAGDRWLPTTVLSDTLVPTAFLPTNEGVYIAYGRTLARRALDLASETTLTNVANAITQLFVAGDFIYYNNAVVPAQFGGTATGLASLRRSTLQAGPTFGGTFNLPAVSAAQTRAYSANGDSSIGGGLPQYSISAAGVISSIALSTYYGYTVPGGTRAYLLPGEAYVANNGGTVFRTTDSSYIGSYGSAFNDLVFLADGTSVILRETQLVAASSANFVPTTQAALSFPGVRAFVLNSNVFVFGASATSGGAFQSAKVAAASFVTTARLPVTVTSGERFTIDDVFFNDGVVGVLSRSKQAVLRWSANSRTYLDPVPLRSGPRLSAQVPGASRALFAYPDGAITQVPIGPGAAVERQLASIGNTPWALADLGDLVMVNVREVGSSGDLRMVLNSSGLCAYLSDWSYWGAGLVWQAGTRRLYSAGTFPSDNGAQYETVPTSGVLPGFYATSSGTNSNAQPPLRFNPEGTLAACANGRIVNADLAQVGVVANNITDAAWLSSGLYTLRVIDGGTQVQQWTRTTYLLSGTLTLPGTPLRIFRLSDSQLVVVTSVQGILEFILVNSDLTVAPSPNAGNVAGAYFANLTSPAAGNVALYFRADGTGVLLVNSTSPTRSALVATNVLLASDGTFVVNARDLTGGTSRTVAGSIAADRSLTGSITSLGVTFSGAASTGATANPAFYQVPAVNGGAGNAYTIVGGDGRVFVLAQNFSTVDGAMATLDASGKTTALLASGARLDLALDAGGNLTVSGPASGTFSNLRFAGLRDGLVSAVRLADISTRGRAGPGGDMLTAGFVISGGASRQILVRAIGPTLANFGISGFLAKPRLTLYSGSTALATSDNWGASPRASDIAAASAQVGAFTLAPTSADAAILTTLNPGNYTAQVTSTDGASGTALVEVYDAGSGAGTGAPHLVDIATLGQVTSNDLLVAGIVITGNAPKRVLVRAVGPTLTSALGVPGTLADPTLTILSGQTTLVTNDDWGITSNASTPNEIAAAAIAAGAFPLAFGGKDAAIVLTLQPGNYTAIVSGKAGAAGVALVEVYEVNN